MAMLDGTVVNVALPRIGAEFHASVAGLQWIVDGYLLSLAALILVSGALGDRYGRRRIYLVGVIWFGVTSLCCGLAPDIGLLVAARILQGVGGALLTPGALAILQSVFVREDRARAIGAWTGLGGVAAAIGPLAGGVLVQVGSWRLAFLINPPLAVLCVLLALRYVPETSDGADARRPDLPLAALGVVGLAGLTALLVQLPSTGLSPLTLVTGVVGVLGLVAFGVGQRYRRHPLVPPALFHDRTFVMANVVTFVLYAALGGVLLLLVLQLQVSLHYPPTLAGLASLPVTVLMLLLSGPSGRLASRIGPRTQLVVGPLLLAAGMLLERRVVPGANYLTGVLPGVVVFGLGLSCTVAPVTATALAAAPDRFAGVASGVNNAIARTGTLLLVAVLPAAVGLTGAGYADPAALTRSWRLALLITAGLGVLGALAALGVRNTVFQDSTDAAEDSVRMSANSAGSMLPPETTATVRPRGRSSRRKR
jgi:EmrB/QacA subfamily drug resistance transporter